MNAFALFGASILASFVSSAVAARLFAPRLQNTDPNRALTLLVAPHMFFRFIGLSFLVPGVVSPSLPAGFAAPAAYGDFIAGILAIVATVALVSRTAWATKSVWLFNIWGAADFLFAFYQGGRVGIQPGMLGAAFFIVTVFVPALLVTHVLIFRLLFGDKPQMNPVAANDYNTLNCQAGQGGEPPRRGPDHRERTFAQFATCKGYGLLRT